MTGKFSCSCVSFVLSACIYLNDENVSVVSLASFTAVVVETDILFHIISVLVGNAVTIFWLT